MTSLNSKDDSVEPPTFPRIRLELLSNKKDRRGTSPNNNSRSDGQSSTKQNTSKIEGLGMDFDAQNEGIEIQNEGSNTENEGVGIQNEGSNALNNELSNPKNEVFTGQRGRNERI